jgi:hypothetical protein
MCKILQYERGILMHSLLKLLLFLLLITSVLLSCTLTKSTETESSEKLGIVGISSAQKGTGFIIARDDRNDVIYIVTQEHVVKDDKCPMVCFGGCDNTQYAIRAEKIYSGENYGGGHRKNAIALLSVQPTFAKHLQKLSLGKFGSSECERGRIINAFSQNGEGRNADVMTPNREEQLCNFSWGGGIMDGFSGAPLITKQNGRVEVVGIVSEILSGTAFVVLAESIRDVIRQTKEGYYILKLMEDNNDSFITTLQAETTIKPMQCSQSFPATTSDTPKKERTPTPVKNGYSILAVNQQTEREQESRSQSVEKERALRSQAEREQELKSARKSSKRNREYICECGVIHTKQKMSVPLSESESSCFDEGRCRNLTK